MASWRKVAFKTTELLLTEFRSYKEKKKNTERNLNRIRLHGVDLTHGPRTVPGDSFVSLCHRLIALSQRNRWLPCQEDHALRSPHTRVGAAWS